MCMEVIGFLIKDKCESKLWDPVTASRGGPAFSHLFFADDLVLFGRANNKNCQNTKDALDVFYDQSGKKVSQGKSRVYSSPNVQETKREAFCSKFGIRSTPNLENIWAFP